MCGWWYVRVCVFGFLMVYDFEKFGFLMVRRLWDLGFRVFALQGVSGIAWWLVSWFSVFCLLFATGLVDFFPCTFAGVEFCRASA